MVGLRCRIEQMAKRLRFVYSIRRSDIFIVSYPKSGTNWIGFFLASVLIRSMPEAPHFLTLSNYRQCIPDINLLYFALVPLSKYQHLQNPRVFTVHAKYDCRFPRVIYLVRDPRDVMVSYYYHHRRVDPKFDMSIGEFITKNEMWPCDWHDHVTSWLEHADKRRIFLVKYEDLHADSLSSFQKILEFCGFHVSEEELKEAMEQSSFRNMRRIEERFGVPGSMADKNISFMRRGEVESWRDELSEEVESILRRRYGKLMAQLGYVPDS